MTAAQQEKEYMWDEYLLALEERRKLASLEVRKVLLYSILGDLALHQVPQALLAVLYKKFGEGVACDELVHSEVIICLREIRRHKVASHKVTAECACHHTITSHKVIAECARHHTTTSHKVTVQDCVL